MSVPREGPRRRPLLVVAVLLVVAALAVVLVVRPGSPPQPEGGSPSTLAALPPVTTDPDPDPAQALFADQRLRWEVCPGPAPTADGEDDPSVTCSRLAVPVDWSQPAGERIELALVRRAAPRATRTGSLVVDPGGPGSSGVGWVRSGQVLTAEAGESFDVVGFDPRGSGASAPVVCLDDAAMDAYLAGEGARAAAGSAGPPEADDDGADGPDALARGCALRGGALLGHVDVASSARDMEALRSALGEEHLDYLGKSWGTLLGATYARLFPQRVGRVVLDGALDPSLDARATAVDQARGLEGALRAWAADCPRRGSCPLDVPAGDDGRTTPGGVRTLLDRVGGLLDAVQDEPLPTGGDGTRVLTGPLALTATIAPLYDERSWPVLDAGLAAALEGDGTALLTSADAYVGRRADGTYASNLIQAFTATTCLDTDTARELEDGPDPGATSEDALARVAPTLGPHLAGDESTCASWPVPGVRTPAPVAADGAAPILVVGTTNDPATPYRWAESLEKQLARSGLLTYEGQGHTAYGRGSACIDAAVDAYLLDGVMPGEGATCTS